MTIYRAAKCCLCGQVVNASGKTMKEVRKDAKQRHDWLYLQSYDGPRSTCTSDQFDLRENWPAF